MGPLCWPSSNTPWLSLSGLRAFGHSAPSTSRLFLLSTYICTTCLSESAQLSLPLEFILCPPEDRSVCHVLLDPRCLPLSPLWTVTLHWLSATCLGALGELEPVSLYPRHQALGSDAKEMFFNNQIIASCKDWNNFFGGESSIKTIDLYSTGNNFNRAILIQRHNESWHVGVWNQLHYFIGHTEEQQCILKTHLHYYTSNNNNTDSNSLATVLHQVVWQRLLVAY